MAFWWVSLLSLCLSFLDNTMTNNALRPQLPRETSKRRGIRIKITMNYSFRRFALGIEISKHYATIDLGFCWIALHY